MTLAQFAGVFGLLAVQLRALDADEGTIRGYYEALKDLDLELVAMAAERMGKRGGGAQGDPHWFPKTSEWRVLTGQIEGERAEALKAVLRKLRTPLCLACEDTGWISTTSKADTSSTAPCPCRLLRRLEILGRRPMPLLPEAVL